MPTEIRHENLTFSYRVVDMRDVDSELLLQSPAIADNLMAILGRMGDTRAAVRRILARIAQLPPEQRFKAMSQLHVAAFGIIGTKEHSRTSSKRRLNACP